jgi:hypothetical protein
LFNAEQESAIDLRRQINRAYLLAPNDNESVDEMSEVFMTGIWRALTNRLSDFLPFV